jgi:hypothetical protein
VVSGGDVFVSVCVLVSVLSSSPAPVSEMRKEFSVFGELSDVSVWH